MFFLSVLQFFGCLVILFACEVAAGIWVFMNRESVSSIKITFTETLEAFKNFIPVQLLKAFMYFQIIWFLSCAHQHYFLVLKLICFLLLMLSPQ